MKISQILILLLFAFMVIPMVFGEGDKKPPELAGKFVDSIERGIQKDFSLHVHYFDRGVEESYWSLLTNATPDGGANTSNVISQQAVISDSQAEEVIVYLAKAKAFFREPYWPVG